MARTKEEIAAYQKEYREANKGKLRQKSQGYHREYNERNKEKIASQKRDYYQANKEKILSRTKKYKAENSDKVSVRGQEYYQKNKKRILKQVLNKYKIDPAFRLMKLIRGRIRKGVKRSNWRKTNGSIKILGCDMGFLKQYLEERFSIGMSWDNIGEWHIDHIVPLISANTIEDLYKLCHYTNLQPLWAADNLKKGAKLNYVVDSIHATEESKPIAG